MKTTSELVKIISELENKGAPIASIGYTTENGEKSDRDIQIGCRLGFAGNLPWGTKVSKTILEHKGRYYVQAVDRNAALRLRKENPSLGVKEAARRSFRSFRIDRIGYVQYGEKILA